MSEIKNQIRIGNIAFRETRRLGNNPYNYVEVIKWYPNPYYGKEDDYPILTKSHIFEEFGIQPHLVRKKSNDDIHSVDVDCFKSPESCYVLVSIEIKEEPTIKAYSIEPFDLEGKEREDFISVLKLAYEYAKARWKELNNY